MQIFLAILKQKIGLRINDRIDIDLRKKLNTEISFSIPFSKNPPKTAQ